MGIHSWGTYILHPFGDTLDMSVDYEDQVAMANRVSLWNTFGNFKMVRVLNLVSRMKKVV